MRILAAGILLLLSVYVRVHGISAVDLQTDEFHWVDRSFKTLGFFKEGRYSSLTSHLGQPGIPPALFMAAAERFAESYNLHYGYKQGDPEFLDRLLAARLSNAFVSSLLAPLTFLLAIDLVGLFPAMLASVLLALSPNHIALSQIAHLDSQVTLYATLSILFFAHAVSRGSLRYKLLSGVFWGLTIATKPTGAVLVPIFVLYKLLRPVFCKPNARGERGIVWSDIWAVVVGQLTFILLYTRMWEGQSQYRYRLKITNMPADVLNYLGAQSLFVRSALFLVLVGGVWVFAQALLQKFPKAKYQVFSLAAVAAGLLVLLPHVAENVLLFWCWVSGLRSMHHVSYGLVWEAPKYGYLGLFLTKLPSLVIIGAVMAVFPYTAQLRSLARKSLLDEKQREFIATLTLFLLCVVIWPLPLSMSTKQALRYAMPIVPALYLLVVAECLWLSASYTAHRLAAQFMTAIIFLFFQLLAFVNSSPHFNLYYNKLSGGLHGAVERRDVLPAVGLRETLSFLHDKARADGQPLDVSMIGDITAVKYLNLKYFANERSLVRFHSIHSPSAAKYFLAMGVFHSDLPEYLGAEIHNVTTDFVYSVDGEELTSVIKIPPFALEQPFTFNLMLSPSATGRRPKLIGPDRNPKNGTWAIEAVPALYDKGFMLFGEKVRLLAGHYVARFELVIPRDDSIDPSFGPERYVVRLDASKNCNRIVTLGEVSQSEVRTFDVACELSEDGMLGLKAYWFGNIPVAITGVRLERASN